MTRMSLSESPVVTKYSLYSHQKQKHSGEITHTDILTIDKSRGSVPHLDCGRHCLWKVVPGTREKAVEGFAHIMPLWCFLQYLSGLTWLFLKYGFSALLKQN